MDPILTSEQDAFITGEDTKLDRISYFEKMLENDPTNATGLLALANEYGKAGRKEDEAATLKKYVENNDDEGNAYLRLGETLAELGREDEARDVFGRGIEQANSHGHDGMVAEMTLALEGLD